ncbi:MAG: GIN domain-containing protein [Allosphingosinicella sp.]
MKTIFLTAGAALALACTIAPAAAQTPVPLPAFDSVQLNGGGTIRIRHGARQSVTLVRGDLATSRFTVDDEGRLIVRACVASCRNYRLEVEIVTPELDAIAINGGGSVRAEGAFPASDNLAIAVNGGGAIDVAAIDSGSVAAAVRGGGEIRTHARSSLAASISGGGAIRYLGNPSVTSSVRGGGSVSPAR